MENNLNELNEMLFDTLRSLKSGEIDDKKATSITNVANSIINNSKTQLQAYKLTQGRVSINSFSLEQHEKKPPEKGDKYDKVLEFSLQKGYSSVSDAISKMGSKSKFEKQFYEWIGK